MKNRPVLETESLRIYSGDCVKGSEDHLEPDSVDLIITDPPYGIEGDQLHRHYHRKEEFVVPDYQEVSREEYAEFSRQWIRAAERVLRPGGSLYVVIGYTPLRDVLNALAETSLQEVNHIIWKYNFGVYTRKKYVSSHYHILYYAKPGGEVTFNTHVRFGPKEKDAVGGSLNYQDREDVWIISREYKPGQKKNKNELPTELLTKMILYSSNPGDVVADFFLGSCSTARTAVGLERQAVGFEVNPAVLEHALPGLSKVGLGELLSEVKTGTPDDGAKAYTRWTSDEKECLMARFAELRQDGKTKKEAIQILCGEFDRGRFGILNVIDQFNATSAEPKVNQESLLPDV